MAISQSLRLSSRQTLDPFASDRRHFKLAFVYGHRVRLKKKVNYVCNEVKSYSGGRFPIQVTLSRQRAPMLRQLSRRTHAYYTERQPGVLSLELTRCLAFARLARTDF
jgi:hypothetical protein